jgi:hypothetical protein
VTEIALVALVGSLARGVERIDRGLPVSLAEHRNDVAAASGVVQQRQGKLLPELLRRDELPLDVRVAGRRP